MNEKIEAIIKELCAREGYAEPDALDMIQCTVEELEAILRQHLDETVDA